LCYGITNVLRYCITNVVRYGSAGRSRYRNADVHSKIYKGTAPPDFSFSYLIMFINVLARPTIGSYHIELRKTFHIHYAEHLCLDIAVDLTFLPFNFAITATINYALGG
jgi:hypothetical protein